MIEVDNNNNIATDFSSRLLSIERYSTMEAVSVQRLHGVLLVKCLNSVILGTFV